MFGKLRLKSQPPGQGAFGFKVYSDIASENGPQKREAIMTMVALACLLTGAVLGMRFRIYMLVLAFAVATVAIGVPALIGHGVLTAAWRLGAGLMLLQTGYLAGIITCYVVLAARSSGPSSASLQRSPQWPIRQDLPTAL